MSAATAQSAMLALHLQRTLSLLLVLGPHRMLVLFLVVLVV
jgi:hypothetical protein